MKKRTAWNSTLAPISKARLERGEHYSIKRTPLKKRGKQAAQDRKNLARAKQVYDGKCAVCGAKGTQHHHLLKRSLYPQYVNEPLNHVLLCDFCHRIAHNQPVPYIPEVIYQARKRVIEKMTDKLKETLCAQGTSTETNL